MSRLCHFLIKQRPVVLGTTIALIAGTALIGGQAEPWEPFASPFKMGPFNRNFNSLPLHGETKVAPWSDTYWPHKDGSIAYRWHGDAEKPWNYRRHSLAELQRMTPAQIAGLSPAEKFDIYRGLTDGPNAYPTVRHARSFSSPDSPSWYGICHGWAPASLNHAQPVPVKVKSPVNGIEIDFGSSDVKALLSFYYGKAGYGARKVNQTGRRCNGDGGSGCGRDMNAGSFHIVITNQLGLKNEGFVGDMSKGNEVWNHPIYRYESDVNAERKAKNDAAPGAVREVKVQTKIWYGIETQPFWSTIRTSDRTRTYTYWLELDKNDNIVGGKYVSIGGGGGKAPDFVWKVQPMDFSEIPSWLPLRDIYRAE